MSRTQAFQEMLQRPTVGLAACARWLPRECLLITLRGAGHADDDPIVAGDHVVQCDVELMIALPHVCVVICCWQALPVSLSEDATFDELQVCSRYAFPAQSL